MTAPGNFAAYSQLKPLEGDIAKDFQIQQELDNRNAQLRAHQDQAKAAKIAADKKEKQDKLDKIQFPKELDTKVQTLNDYGRRVLAIGADKINESRSLLQKDIDNPFLSSEERADLYGKIDKLNRLPETLLNSSVAFTQMKEAYDKGRAAGTTRINPQFEAFAKDGATGWVGHIDDDANFMTAFKDTNGDGVVDKTDAVTHEDLTGKTDKFEFKPSFDREALLNNHASKLESKVYGTDNGDKKVVNTKFSPASATIEANNLLLKQDGTPTLVLEDFAEKAGVPLTIKDAKGNEVPNTAALNKLVNSYAGDLLHRTKNSHTEDVHLTGSKFSFSKSQAQEKKEANKPIDIKLADTPFMDDYHMEENGERVAKERSKEGVYENGISFPVGVPLKNIGGKDGSNNLNIRNVFINKKGQIIYTADILDSKSKTKKEAGEGFDEDVVTESGSYGQTTVVATATAEAAIAKALNFDNTEKLKKHLYKKNGITKEKQNQSSNKDPLELGL